MELMIHLAYFWSIRAVLIIQPPFLWVLQTLIGRCNFFKSVFCSGLLVTIRVELHGKLPVFFGQILFISKVLVYPEQRVIVLLVKYSSNLRIPYIRAGFLRLWRLVLRSSSTLLLVFLLLGLESFDIAEQVLCFSSWMIFYRFP